MSKIIDLYLDRVLTHAELAEPRATEVREELADHLHSHREKALTSGEKPEDASIQAIAKMGDPKKVGQGISRPWRWVDIRTHGTAKGFIAIGPKAIGVFAFGNACCGIIAIGVLPVGIISIGAIGLGLFTWAAIAAGGVALGGLAIGAVASGGVAIGILSEGLATIGASSAPAWMHSLIAAPRWMMAHMGISRPDREQKLSRIFDFGTAITAGIRLSKRRHDREQNSQIAWTVGSSAEAASLMSKAAHERTPTHQRGTRRTPRKSPPRMLPSQLGNLRNPRRYLRLNIQAN